MIHPVFDEGLTSQITANLDLRQPNADALVTIAKVAEQRLSGEGSSFEGVIDVATGVGKTFILAAAIDYFTALGYRNFAVIAPGRTVARKTVGNFTPGHRKSLLGGMDTQPVVITSENFDTPATSTRMDDETLAKLFIFTVQSLLTPTSKADRRTHEFQENLGTGFYQKMADIEDLIVFADEHHLYGGKKFEAAVHGLTPRMLIGLTATPLKGSPVIFRYPLPAAIAGGYVKTPVIVGRSDDRADFITKLTDGVRLLDAKQKAVDAWREANPGTPKLNAVMLVVAPDTDAADECVGILRHTQFHGGTFQDAILNVHSNITANELEQALEDLDGVEDPDSKVRVIVSVGMLKEGWDVKNVFVICSLRANVSEILTEQTLGRGLRLPFGKPTGVDVLDFLEVVAHERYDALIAKIDRLREDFIDWKTLAATEAAKTADTGVPPVTPPVTGPVAVGGMMVAANPDGSAQVGVPAFAETDARIGHTDEAAAELGERLHPRPDFPDLMLPVVRSTIIESPFSLADITDLDPFRVEGRRIAANPDDRLRRTVLEGKVIVDEATGERTARMVRRAAADEVISAGDEVPTKVLIERLREDIMNSGVVPARRVERTILDDIITAFIEGLGDAEALAAYGQRAADGIIHIIQAAQAGKKPQSRLDDDVTLRKFEGIRIARKTVYDKGFPFTRGVGYTGWVKSLFAQDWFDGGSTEFALAHLLDETDEVTLWLRLQTGDLPLTWAGDERAYNPDFIVVDEVGIQWVIEGKADDTAQTPEVVAKAKAARRWATHVSAATGTSWRYVFVREADIKTAKGSWTALKRLAGAD